MANQLSCSTGLDLSRLYQPIQLPNCDYKVHPAGIGGAKPCNFNVQGIPQPIQDALNRCINTRNMMFVIIPAQTKMYRGTLVVGKMGRIVPWVKEKDFGWFTSTKRHQGNINYTHIQPFMTRAPLLCIFEPRLHSTGMRGNTFYREVVRYSKLLNSRDPDLVIDGYIGCDECEIGLTKEAIMTKLLHGKIRQEKSLKYID